MCFPVWTEYFLPHHNQIFQYRSRYRTMLTSFYNRKIILTWVGARIPADDHYIRELRDRLVRNRMIQGFPIPQAEEEVAKGHILDGRSNKWHLARQGLIKRAVLLRSASLLF